MECSPERRLLGQVSDEGIKALAAKLPQSLKDLTIDMSGTKVPTAAATAGTGVQVVVYSCVYRHQSMLSTHSSQML